MFKGNTACCSKVFNWDNVDRVVLDDGSEYNYVKETFSHMYIGLNSQSVKIDDINIPLKSVTVDNFAAKAAEIIRLCGRLLTNQPTTQFHRLGNDLPSESDDESVPDPPIIPAFNAEEWRKILCNWQHVQGRFEKAKECSFGNAGGKHFFERLMKFICILVEDMGETVNLATASSGEDQPGCSNYTQCVMRSIRSSSRSSTISPVPMCKGKGKGKGKGKKKKKEEEDNEENEQETRKQEEPPSSAEMRKITRSYPDVVHWDQFRNLFTTNVEIKSETHESGEHQCIAQMFGAFREHQKVMLGLIVHEAYVEIKILMKNSEYKCLTLYTKEEKISLTDSMGLKVLAKMLFAFMYCVDC